MSAIEVVEHRHAPRGHGRSRAWTAPARLREILRAAGERLARSLFQTSRLFFAAGDRLAAARDRVPRRPDMPASTWLAYGAVGVMAAILAHDLLGPAPAVSSVTPAPERRPDWIEVARPHGAFDLQSPALDGLESSYLVRRHRTGGGRKDILAFGDANAPGAFVRVSLYRPGAEGMPEPDALEAAAALASESGIAAEIQHSSGKLKTKFGDLPIVNMRVQGKDGWRNCIAVAGAWNDPRFGLVAWWCNAGREMVALGEFACVLDRTALMSAGGDGQLAEFFARAELKRNFCGMQSSFFSPTPRLVNDWISAKRSPPLRGPLHGR